MTLPDSELQVALEQRLRGEDSASAPASADVYLRGNEPAELPDQLVLIEPPRLSGERFIDGGARYEVRQDLRATIHAEKGAPLRPTKARELAQSIHDSITAADLTLPSHRAPYVPVPTIRPMDEGEREGRRFKDTLVQYRLLF